MVSATPGGTLLEVRVVPRAPRSGVAGQRDGALLVRLAAPPVDGEANAALVALVAGLLDLPRRAVTIAAGERSRRKRLKVEGLTPQVVAARLGAAAA